MKKNILKKTACALTAGTFLMMSLQNGASQQTAAEILAGVTVPTGPQEPQVTFDFKDAPLQLILEHMSRELGFVINNEVGTLRGEGTAQALSPIGKDTAVDLLTTQLSKSGYALRRNRDVLTISRNEDAGFTSDIVDESNPDNIPPTDKIVTQLIRIKYIDALRLINDIRVLVPSETMIANEASNTIMVTDTQANIRRLAEIIAALDTSISSIAAIKVFPLVNADAEELADIVEDLFEAPSSGGGGFGGGNNRGGRGGGGRNNRGGGNFFQVTDGEGNPMGTGQSVARDAATSVTAVADERTNSLIVSAPDNYMASITTLIQQIDTVESELTNTEVYTLENASAEEVVAQINEVFAEDSGNSSNNNRGGRGGNNRGGFNFGGGGAAGGARTLALTRVIAVADPRTNSVIVDASPGQMFKVSRMIRQLDEDKARKKTVHVIQLNNADGPETVTMLQQMFGSNPGNGRSVTAPSSSALTERQGSGSDLEVSN